MKTRNMYQRRGFSLIECGALVLVLSMIGMTVGPSLQSVRSQQQGTASAANLMSIGQGGAAYGFFNQGELFSYSWRGGETYVMPDGRTRTPITDFDAAIRQNQAILQRLTGRINGQTKILPAAGRMPHKRYSHLVLIDFLNEPMETTKYIDPADANQLAWHKDPLEYLKEPNTLPYGSGSVPPGYDSDSGWNQTYIKQRWTFASSYTGTTASYLQDPPNSRFLPVAATPHLFSGGPGVQLGRRNISEVAFPGQKVWMFEEFDREQAGSPYFGYDHARSEKLMFDGSVNSWASGDAHASIVPEYGLAPWKQIYVPLDTFPVPMGGLGDMTLVHQRYRWTFRGLGGVDYGLAVPPRGPRAKGP